jgi:hypothetical protein
MMASAIPSRRLARRIVLRGRAGLETGSSVVGSVTRFVHSKILKGQTD